MKHNIVVIKGKKLESRDARRLECIPKLKTRVRKCRILGLVSDQLLIILSGQSVLPFPFPATYPFFVIPPFPEKQFLMSLSCQISQLVTVYDYTQDLY